MNGVIVLRTNLCTVVSLMIEENNNSMSGA
jgi:hypothetical protein